MCIFIDEMPFYLNLTPSTGRSPKGERAFVKTLPVSNLAFRTQAVMAVESSSGLIYGATFPSEKQTRMKEGRSTTRPVLRAAWSKEKFKEYMERLLAAMWRSRQSSRERTSTW